MPARTRRTFLKAMAAVNAPAIHGLGAQSKRPNILLCIADDWGWPFASIAGDAVVKTPTFDRLAQEGVLFTNAFVSAPSCSPSRAAILTGQWHWRLEEGANLGGTLPAKFPVYPNLLDDAGYHTGFTRKGWGPGNETAGGRKRNPAGARYSDFSSFLSARTDDRPFCFWFGSLDPHRKYEWESGVKSGMRLEAVEIPPYLPEHEIVRKDMCDYYLEVQRFDTEVGENLKLLEESGQLENTMVVITGDNGWPFPRAKASLYDAGTHVPLAVYWPGRVKGGRVVEDFVSLSDLAPTFLEAAGLKPPREMTARSLMDVLTSTKSGRGADESRDHVLTGMERHVPCRGENRGGYPMRAIRTHDFLYIHNFEPDRWPAGDPNGLEKAGAQPYSYEQLVARTQLALADIDAGPTKAYLVRQREESGIAGLYELSAGKRLEHELYDMRNDPHQIRNVAADAKYANDLESLQKQLMAELKQSGDPRAHGRGDVFDSYPYLQRA
ncbi:MAG: sulfatase family protein [Bryobacteraceae bacterium]